MKKEADVAKVGQELVGAEQVEPIDTSNFPRRPNGTPIYPEDAMIRVMTRAAFVGPTQAAKDYGISRDTVSTWCYSRYYDRYRELRDSEIQERKKFEAEQHREAARERRRLASMLSDELERKYKGLEARDLSTALRNLDVGAGVHTDKAGSLEEGITSTQRSKDINEIVRSLAASGMKLTLEVGEDKPEAVEVEAEEVVNAES